MRRLWFLLRVALHDWMWEGGSRPDLGRRLARGLPLYFSDPYCMSDSAIADALASGEPASLDIPSGWVISKPELTTTTGVGTTFSYTTTWHPLTTWTSE